MLSTCKDDELTGSAQLDRFINLKPSNMGLQIWGAFGGFKGKTGALIGARVNGQNVIRPLPHPSQTPPSVAQLNQRAKFKTLVSFLRRLTPLIRVGFQNAHKEKQSEFNAAFVENYDAITGVAPNYVIDYPQFMYSKGILSGAYNAIAAIDIPANIEITWTGQLATGIGLPTDLATIVAYNPSKGQFVRLVGAVPRSALNFNLAVPPDFAGDDCHVWISMVSADGKMASDSYYIGEFTIL